MKFESNSSTRRRRSQPAIAAPAMVETLEQKALLAGPQVLTPTGTIADSTPVITWDAVDTAVSYDLWVSDVDSREVLFIEYGLGTTNFTPTTELNIGRNRIWVRANFADGSTTGWGPGKDVSLLVNGFITGPVNALQPATPQKLNETQPTITWTNAPGARSYDIFFSDQTRLTSTVYNIRNLTPVLGLDGNPIPDGKGDVLREEVREFQVPDDLPMGKYRVFIRTSDFNGNTTAWSTPFDFEIAPAVSIKRPFGPSFQNPALLEWNAVDGATHYEVWVNRAGAALDSTPLYNPKLLTDTSYQLPTKLADGNYVFHVRAKLRTTGRPEVVGLWSAPALFGTLSKPVISAPVGVPGADPANRIVTEARPIIEWNAIDKAARYEIWIDRTASSSVYLKANSSTNSYQLTSDILPGSYFVWVRAVSTTGKTTAWSEPFRFTATGGAPVITSPTNGGAATVLPTITWAGVTEAASYEIQIAWLGVDFDYVQVSGITATSYTLEDPLSAGSYRVWVRAIKADGTAQPWSSPVTFTVAELQIDGNATEELVLTRVLKPEVSQPNEPAAVIAVSTAPVDDGHSVDQPTTLAAIAPLSEVPPTPVRGNEQPVPAWPLIAEADLIERLAEACSTDEWWTAS